MKEQEIYNHQLAIRYFEGRITPSEEEILFRFVNDAPSNERMFRQWEEEWMLSYKLIPEVSNEWKQLQRRMQVRQSLNGVFSTKHMQLQRFIAVAAIACVLLLSGTYSFYLYRNTETTDNRFALETAYGEKSKLILADGTVVWLNAGSSLQYAGNFNSKNREVFLTGEAYFEVTKQSDGTPFVVKTDQYSVLVKGTKFNVKAYFDEKSVVTLAEGKVEVETNDCKNRLTLKPNEQVSYSGSSGLALEKNINTNTVKLWMKGEGAFIQCRLDHIVRDLERKFDVKIVITDHSLSSEVFTCRFKDTATIEQVLHLLKETRRLDYLFEGEQIRIFKPLK